MDRDTIVIPSSPTNSSPSSSDLDTVSTGSFFPDRSTTLGTLMGVSFAASEATVRPAIVPLRRERNGSDGGSAKKAAEQRRRRSREGRRSWWRLCRDNMAGPTSLGDFLQVERRSMEGVVAEAVADVGHVADGRFFAEEEHVVVGGGRLFENGRVLPPQSAAAGATVVVERRRDRVAVLVAGICSGGDG